MRSFMADLPAVGIGANANELAIIVVYATGLCESWFRRNPTAADAQRRAADGRAMNGIVLNEEEAGAFIRPASGTEQRLVRAAARLPTGSRCETFRGRSTTTHMDADAGVCECPQPPDHPPADPAGGGATATQPGGS